MKATRLQVVLGVLTVVTMTTGSVYAAVAGSHHLKHGSATKGVDTQAARWQTTDLTFSHDKWATVDWSTDGSGVYASDGGDIKVFANGLVSLTFGATFSGGPVDIRAVGGKHVFRPGPVHFAPSPRGGSFSFTFVDEGGHPACGRTLHVQIKPATAQPATVKRADVVAVYKTFTRKHDNFAACG